MDLLMITDENKSHCVYITFANIVDNVLVVKVF